MASLFRRNPAKTPFGKRVLAVHEQWQNTIRWPPDPVVLEEPNFICMMAATAGATVALGGYGMYLRDHIGGNSRELEAQGVHDPTVRLAGSFDEYEAVEAAWRVVAWALLADQAAFFWRPNYLRELNECAAAFGFDNDYEKRVIAYGSPDGDKDVVEDEVERTMKLIRGSLISMIGASSGVDLDPDDVWIGIVTPAWSEQFLEGRKVANEYISQIAPEGLPIWE